MRLSASPEASRSTGTRSNGETNQIIAYTCVGPQHSRYFNTLKAMYILKMEWYAQNHRRLMKSGCKLSDWQLAALSIRAPHSCVLFRQEATLINSTITIDQNRTRFRL